MFLQNVAHKELRGESVFTLSHDCQGLAMVPKVLGILQRSNITHDYIYGSGDRLCQVSLSLSPMRDMAGRPWFLTMQIDRHLGSRLKVGISCITVQCMLVVQCVQGLLLESLIIV